MNNHWNSEAKESHQDLVYSKYETTILRSVNIAILVSACVVCIGCIFQITLLKMLKPIPMILMIIYIHKMNPNQFIVPRLIEYGLIAGLIGDVLLMFEENIPFIIGTLFFFIGHLLYIKAYLTGQSYRQISKFGFWIRILGVVILCGVYGFNMYHLFGRFPIPVFFQVYGAALTGMMIVSMFRYEKTVDKSFWMILIGALLFGVSDSLLSNWRLITHANQPKVDNSPFIVIITYYASQYLITHGSLIHPPSNQDKQIISNRQN